MRSSVERHAAERHLILRFALRDLFCAAVLSVPQSIRTTWFGYFFFCDVRLHRTPAY